MNKAMANIGKLNLCDSMEWESDEELLTRFCDWWKINDAHLIPIIRAHKNTASTRLMQPSQKITERELGYYA